jgi:alpha/beta superfamily hydrolase
VSALIGIAVPISRYDLEAVGRSSAAKFFIHGERDELFPLKEVREFYARAADPKELVVIDGADHVFDGKTLEVGDAIEDLLTDWPG